MITDLDTPPGQRVNLLHSAFDGRARLTIGCDQRGTLGGRIKRLDARAAQQGAAKGFLQLVQLAINGQRGQQQLLCSRTDAAVSHRRSLGPQLSKGKLSQPLHSIFLKSSSGLLTSYKPQTDQQQEGLSR
jgi:hypothetical protein